jgi:hypothetical protein
MKKEGKVILPKEIKLKKQRSKKRKLRSFMNPETNLLKELQNKEEDQQMSDKPQLESLPIKNLRS